MMTGTIKQEGRYINVYDATTGANITRLIPQRLRQLARNTGVGEVESSDKGVTWYLKAGGKPMSKQTPAKQTHKPAQRIKETSTVAAPLIAETPEIEEAVIANLVSAATVDSTEIENITSFVHKESIALRPSHFHISDLKWKYLVRAVMRGKNIMMTGPAGTGKTSVFQHITKALQRPSFYFNLGATQDPRTTLIGNTHFKKDEGTYFAQSLFVTAIQTENAVILLDEISRAHPEAWNILMTVLDPGQRYLRLDEKDDAPTIKVAKNVSFIATANIGNEYTSTRTMDRALLDRFVVVEMEELSQPDEFKLLTQLYPTATKSTLTAITEIADDTRKNVRSEDPKVGTSISTRMTVEMGSLLVDGFTLPEIAEVTIYPFYSPEGGVDSERTYMKQLVQKYIKTQDAALFGEADTAVKASKLPF